MKKKYISLTALLALFLFAPIAYSQINLSHERYVEYPEKGLALNKYLTSTIPNANGEYFLRLESFATGAVTKTAIPTDFVLVLDSSGSMLFDCLYGQTRPASLTKAENDRTGFLRPAHSTENLHEGLCHYAYQGAWNRGNIGEKMSLEWADDNIRITQTFFAANASSSLPTLYYYYEPDKTFYWIRREKSGDYCRIFITTSGGTKRYLICAQNGNRVTTTLSTNPPANSTANNDETKILLIGYAGDNIYRPIQRREALISGVNAFIDAIYDHNQNDKFADGVKKHQVSMVAFGNDYSSGDSEDITPMDVTGYGTRVIKGFDEITSSNKDSYKNAIDTYIGFTGVTFVYYGIHLAKRLFQDLQNNPQMVPVDEIGRTIRNKVVVFFTDGEPTKMTADGEGSPDNTGIGTQYEDVRLTLNDARVIKAARMSGGDEINGKIFTIDLSGSEYAATFLEHLSSNYPDGKATGGGTNGTMSEVTYGGTAITPASDRIFYMDASARHLDSVFQTIVEANTGDTGASMVAMDVLTNDFDLPANIITGNRVKLYTAQCIGVKCIDGTDYLAFAEPVAVGSRQALDEIWFNDEDDDGNTVWTKQTGIKIDNNISCYIENNEGENERLVIRGFDFANLWCGLDEEVSHHNTRQISADDPNWDYQVDNYRGFKLIAEFPIVVAKDALGGLNIPTNIGEMSGIYYSDGIGNPTGTAIALFPKPVLSIPVTIIVQKTGLQPGESASFTLQRKKVLDGTDYEDFGSFILTGMQPGGESPSIRLMNLDPSYYYRVKETGWSWSYENSIQDGLYPSTEDPTLTNPIVINNTYRDTNLKHAEAKAYNIMTTKPSSD